MEVEASTLTDHPAPAHLWAVGTIGLLWNAFGCFDYVTTQLGKAQLSPEMTAYIATFPAWLTASWALGVWGSLAGSVLLLMRSRHAVLAFALSLLGLAVSQGYQMLVAPPPQSPPIVIEAMIWGALVFFLIYARRMRAEGVLT